MMKAFAVKGVAIVVGATALRLLPGGWGWLAVALIAIATIAFFTFAIAHPASQFFVPVIDRAHTARSQISLTFDDGPDPTFTAQILDALAAHQAKATFFIVGERAARHPELLRRMVAEGHAIGSHTHRHRLGFHFGSVRYIRAEIDSAIATIASITGTRPWLFRPPQGLRTPCFARGWASTSGLRCVTWTARGLDAFTTTAEAIVGRLVEQLRPGAIIALHDGAGFGGSSDRHATVAALPHLLATCRDRNLACVTVDDLVSERGNSIEVSSVQGAHG